MGNRQNRKPYIGRAATNQQGKGAKKLENMKALFPARDRSKCIT